MIATSPPPPSLHPARAATLSEPAEITQRIHQSEARRREARATRAALTAKFVAREPVCTTALAAATAAIHAAEAETARLQDALRAAAEGTRRVETAAG
jgi:hypothetical protein